MDGKFQDNDIEKIVAMDKAHVWHHLSQHKPYETSDPRVIVEGKGMRVWDQHGKEHLDAVSGGVYFYSLSSGERQYSGKVCILR